MYNCFFEILEGYHGKTNMPFHLAVAALLVRWTDG